MNQIFDVREMWHRANERTSLFSLPKVNKYLRQIDQDRYHLSRAQKDEIRDYWDRYDIHFPFQWHELYYGITGVYDPAFVPNNVFHYTIKYHLNGKTFATVWSDKCYLDKFVSGINTPKCLIRNINGRLVNEGFELIDAKEGQLILDHYESLVIKPSVLTDTGKGVKLLRAPFRIEDLNKEYKKNYIIQEPIIQHEDMKFLNPSSVNTIRVNSALFDTEAVILSAFVKVGQMGAFADNSGHDRFFIGINDDGTYRDYAIDHDLKKYMSIPSGYKFADKQVPSFDLICEGIKQAHKSIPHFGLAFWDVCVREDGEPVVVEVNLRSPDSYIPQAAVGPFFGKNTRGYWNMFRKGVNREGYMCYA